MAQTAGVAMASAARQRLASARPPCARQLAATPPPARSGASAAPRRGRLHRRAAGVQPYPDPFPGVQPGDDLPPDYGEPKPNPPKHRRAGVVLHPTSLPGKYGIGEIGAEAKRFVDWLAGAGMQLWQVLPLVPPETSYWSPYSGLDGLCGNALLIPLDELAELGLLSPSELPPPAPPAPHADFPAVHAAKAPLLAAAAARLLGDPAHAGLRAELEAFRGANPWVEQSALFSVLAGLPELAGRAWWDWAPAFRDRDPDTLARARAEHAEEISTFIALQFLFDRFWKDVKSYANARGIRLVGDMPIYVGGHSADVWASRRLFELTAEGRPALVSGVPPDAFSETGQLWGSPLYDWNAQAADGYRRVRGGGGLRAGRRRELGVGREGQGGLSWGVAAPMELWWIQRFERSMQLYDETRVDHFRAFAGYWAVEAWRETAMIGTWKRGPGAELFEKLEEALGEIPILAEDLGVITPDVHALRLAIGAPGMIVLQARRSRRFAWGGGPTNTHLPHNIYENCFVYPGTHDNQTTVGWWQNGAQPYERTLIREYTGMTGDDLAWTFIHEAFKSVARTADIMRLDDRARMNTPGRAAGNWTWRVGDSGVWEQLRPEQAALRHMIEQCDRLAPGAPPAPAPAAGHVGAARFR
eukprot:scaffold7.g3420.t1